MAQGDDVTGDEKSLIDGTPEEYGSTDGLTEKELSLEEAYEIIGKFGDIWIKIPKYSYPAITPLHNFFPIDRP